MGETQRFKSRDVLVHSCASTSRDKERACVGSRAAARSNGDTLSLFSFFLSVSRSCSFPFPQPPRLFVRDFSSFFSSVVPKQTRYQFLTFAGSVLASLFSFSCQPPPRVLCTFCPLPFGRRAASNSRDSIIISDSLISTNYNRARIQHSSQMGKPFGSIQGYLLQLSVRDIFVEFLCAF